MIVLAAIFQFFQQNSGNAIKNVTSSDKFQNLEPKKKKEL